MFYITICGYSYSISDQWYWNGVNWLESGLPMAIGL